MSESTGFYSPTRLRGLLVGAPILGVVTAGALITYAFIPQDDDAFFSSPIAFLLPMFPALILALLVGNPPADHPRRLSLLAMAPMAFGLVTATVVIGFPLPEFTSLMVTGGVLSALPFLAAALLARQAR